MTTMRYGLGRGNIVVSRQPVASVRLAGLQRAQRYAGEAFGYDDLATLPRLKTMVAPLAWLGLALAACIALAVVALR